MNEKYPNSCDFCRKRKLKCSRDNPECATCAKLRKTCIYTPRGKRVPLTKALIQQLHNRINLLEQALDKVLGSKEEVEELIKSIREEAPASSIHPRDEQSSDRDEINPDTSPQDHQNPLRAEDLLLYDDFCYIDDIDWYEDDPSTNDIEDLDDDSPVSDNMDNYVNSNNIIDGMVALSFDDYTNQYSGKPFYGMTSSSGLLRFLKRQERRHSSNDIKFTPNYLFNKKNFDLLKSGKADILLNDPSFRDQIINSYYEKFHNCYPLINKSVFLREFEADKLGNGNGKKSIKEISFNVLLNTILAIGALCKFGESSVIDLLYYKRVKAILKEINILECGSYSLLTALILLGNYTQKRNKPNTGWNYQGLSLRMAISFGLHKEVNVIKHAKILNSSIVEVLERRRRLWWSIFFFDVGLSITFGRPLHLPLLESIDINYPSNIDDKDIDSNNTEINIESITKSYPTIYAGLIEESKLSRISYHIYSQITNVQSSSIESGNSNLKTFIALNRSLEAFKLELPEYLNENDDDVRKILISICPVSWFKIDLDGTQKNPSWFELTRRRIIWRYKNLQILMFRSYIWEVSKGMPSVPEKDEKSMLYQAIKICSDAAYYTIISISNFVDNSEIDTLSSWYSTYFIFQAVLIPIILLYKDDSERDHLMEQVELTKDTLTKLKPFNSLASNLIETIIILVAPLNCNHNREFENEGGAFNFEKDQSNLGLNDLRSTTNNLFSNGFVDGSSNHPYNISDDWLLNCLDDGNVGKKLSATHESLHTSLFSDVYHGNMNDELEVLFKATVQDMDIENDSGFES